MKRVLCGAGILLSGLLLAIPAVGQGPLAPASGPTETMKSLDQIEPRTPISELPFAITEPGSYFVTGNLTSTEYGIIVAASGVTIDLGGHTLSGSGNDAGIVADTNNMVVVQNGVIEGFAYGIRAINSNYGRYERLVVRDNVNSGIGLFSVADEANGNVIQDVSVIGHGQIGVLIAAYSGGVTRGNMVLNSSIMNNQRNGIRLLGDGGRVSGNIIRDTVILGSTDFSAMDLLSENGGVVNGNIISGCQIVDNAHSGLRVMAFGADTQATGNSIENNKIMRNGDQIPALSVRGVSGGQANGNSLVGNRIAENSSHGIEVDGGSGGSTARGNVIRDSNVSHELSNRTGIRLVGDTEGTRVENNTVMGHLTGYQIDATSAFVFRNVSLSNMGSFVGGPGNLIAPNIDSPGEQSNPNAWANVSR